MGDDFVGGLLASRDDYAALCRFLELRARAEAAAPVAAVDASAGAAADGGARRSARHAATATSLQVTEPPPPFLSRLADRHPERYASWGYNAALDAAVADGGIILPAAAVTYIAILAAVTACAVHWQSDVTDAAAVVFAAQFYTGGPPGLALGGVSKARVSRLIRSFDGLLPAMIAELDGARAAALTACTEAQLSTWHSADWVGLHVHPGRLLPWTSTLAAAAVREQDLSSWATA